MKCYLCKLPITYRNTTDVNKIDFHHDHQLSIERTELHRYKRMIEDGSFSAEENVFVHIFTQENRIYIEFDMVYAHNEKEAAQWIKRYLNELLPSLTFKFNNTNVNKHAVQYRLTFNMGELDIKEVAYKKYEEHQTEVGRVRFASPLNVTEHIGIQMTEHINMDGYGKILDRYNRHPLLKQLIDRYTRAMGDTDYISKYFNLFTIIEALENHYRNCVSKKLLSTDEIDVIVDCLKEADEGNDGISIDRKVIGRIQDVLSKSTKDSRWKKLLIILNNLLKIDHIEVFSESIEIDGKFVKDIINYRNSLFHAKDMDDDELEKLKTCVHHLFVVSDVIISRMVEGG